MNNQNIPYIKLEWNSEPRSDENICEFECVTAVIKHKDTWLFFALEFIKGDFGLVGWALDEWEEKDAAIIREVEVESWYRGWKIISVIFEKIYWRWYKPRKAREELAIDKVYFIEVEEKNKSEILWADEWTKWQYWFTKDEMLDKLTLTTHIHFYKEYLKIHSN